MQEDRILGLETPLGKDVLILHKFTGVESISKPFFFKLFMFSSNANILPQQLIGKPLCFHINRSGKPIRYFHGIVNKFYIGAQKFNKIQEYVAEVIPWFSFLHYAVNSRIFQNLNIKEIIQTIFKEYRYDDYSLQGLNAKYKSRTYCVQYNESNFTFISRLLEEEGICYFFEHHKDKHVLIMSDGNKGFKNNKLAVSYRLKNSSMDCIYELGKGYIFETGKITYGSYNFLQPSKNTLNNLETKMNFSTENNYELYNFTDESISNLDINEQTKLLKEMQDATREIILGKSTYPNFAPGNKLKINNKNTYILSEVRHQAFDVTHYPNEKQDLKKVDHADYINEFECMPEAITYRPPRIVSKPSIYGLQTAIVVGPEGEEIHTDKYGRIKIRFFWDREGKSKKELSSCWIRYMQTWTGKKWGTLFIPRVGQEVIVSFINGDPDQPIVVGGLYNFDQMPPYDLPAKKTQSGIKCNSTKKGDVDQCNEFRFDDQKDNEQIYLHAQRNLQEIVENDQFLEINHDQNIKIKNKRTVTVADSDDITIVESGNSVLKLNKGNQQIKISEGGATIEAMKSIEFKVGGNKIVIDPQGIHLKGVAININGTIVKAKADASLKLEGVFIESDASGMLKLQGSLVMVN